MEPDIWFPYRTAPEGTGRRLICLPHAGGSAAAWRRWSASLGPEYDVCAVELPGHGRRGDEPPDTDVFDIVIRLGDGFRGLFEERPFVLVGHSFGGLVAYELARYLRREYGREPDHLVVAASPAPTVPSRLEPVAGLSDSALLREMDRRYGGVPEELASDPGLGRTMVDALRADLRASEAYVHMPDEPLTCPILSVRGARDWTIRSEDVEPWRAESRGATRFEVDPGGHFFARDTPGLLLDHIRGLTTV